MADLLRPKEEIYMRVKLMRVMDHIRKLTLTAPPHFSVEDYRLIDRRLCGAGACLSKTLEQLRMKQQYRGWLLGRSSDISTFGDLRVATATEFLDRVYVALHHVGQEVDMNDIPPDVLFGQRSDATGEDQQRQQDDDYSWYRHGLGRQTLFDARNRQEHFQRIPPAHPAPNGNFNPTHPLLQYEDSERFRAYISSIDFDAIPPTGQLFATSTPIHARYPTLQVARPAQPASSISTSNIDAETQEYMALVDKISDNIRAFIFLLQTHEADTNTLY